ncbi:DUF418 domain-containing protein [Phenylobacterium sp.]|uniref:DUF418 domain-containing protein n=1 Tax=Phenylobacterium sp. TaxID=1871053 RepID=UPI002EDB1D20
MTSASAGRHLSIDAVRGFAVLGILLMNIVGMGLPSFAYIDPTYAGGSTGADMWTWAVNNVFTDGKMRALFTMLFGASTVLIADRAEAGTGLSPAATHYRRMLWLLLIGLLHAVFLWFGDILVPYAIAGLIVFPFRKLSPRVQIAIGVAILVLLLAKNAMGPGIPSPPPGAKAAELAGFRGDFLDATQARLNMLVLFYLIIHPFDTLPEAIGQMFIGMALFRVGFFTLGWSTRAYALTMAIGYLIAAPFTAWLAYGIQQSGFEPKTLHELEVWQQLSRPFIALAHASVLLLMIRAGWLEVLTTRLAAAGRMAFSNYLMTSVITSLVFCGYGFGLYGELSRAQQLWVVAGVWAFILLWSRPWLARFHYGPFEWLWRSLVQWKPQPFVKGAKPATATT